MSKLKTVRQLLGKRDGALFDAHNRPIQDSRRMDSLTGAPFIPDGFNYAGFYDALNYSTNRASRPFFATDSRATLTAWSRVRALALARWAYINVPVVKGAVDLMARLTVGTGFSPVTHMDNKGLAKIADAYYLEKAADIGFMHGESMDELLLHDSRCVDVDGDLGYVMTADETDQPKLQLIESHRIKNGEVSDPTCRDGVWVDKFGRRTAFNIALPEEENSKRIDARDFIYLAERNRPDELRSMTNLIHALSPLQDLYELLGFAMQSAKKNAEIASVIETATPDSPPGIGPTVDTLMRAAQAAENDQSTQPRQMITREQIYGSGGKVPILPIGDQFKTYAHNQPAPTIQAWSEFIIRGISVGFGVPFEVLWNPEAIGGANTRLITALLRARLQQRRAGLIFPKLQRVRYWILSRGIKRNEIPFADYTKVSWNPNFSDITVDAGRESKERRENVLAGTDTYSGYYAENGKNYLDQQINVRHADLDAQCAAAAELITRYPRLTFTDALNRISLIGTFATRVGETAAEPPNPGGGSNPAVPAK